MPTQLIDPVFEGRARALDVHQRRHDVLATSACEANAQVVNATKCMAESALSISG